MGWIVLVIVGAARVGNSIGFTRAHVGVETECQKLGKFYVGDKVFHCTEAGK